MHFRRQSAASLLLTLYTLFHASRADPQCAIEPNSIVSDACISYAALETLNQDIAPILHDLTQNTDFFAYYRLNLYNKVCPFWNDEQSLCGNRACAVDTIEDEKDIPIIWRAEELSKLEGARAEHPAPALQRKRPKQRPLDRQLGDNVDESCVLEVDDECDERDYCVPEDEGAASKGDYVSLVNNTERFTGYSGPGARQVWDAVYKENCFAPEPAGKSGKQLAATQLRNVFQEYGRQNVDSSDNAYPLDDECLEQRAFYRIISGMHASISAHICWDYFNQTTGEWVRNISCYKDRLHMHPERVSNIYFNYALLSRALVKARKHLQSYTFCSGDVDQDYETKQKVLLLADSIGATPHTFDESIMFADPGELELKDDFKHRFRNISRLMDCVGCDKCRLWGKVQTAGYGAALKILFEFDENKDGDHAYLRRTELVALVNTFGRVSHSLDAVQRFRHAVNTGEMHALAWDDVSQKSTDDDWAIDDDEMGEEVRRPRPRGEEGVWDAVKSEWHLIWRTYKMVLRSWLNLPFTLGGIVVMELSRLWNFWLGLPVAPRSWEIRFPTRDEL